MRLYKLTCICTSIMLLSGCNVFSSKPEEPSSTVVSDVVKKEPVVLVITHKEKEEEPIVSFHRIVIDEEIVSTIGESKSYFTHADDSPFKISLINIGTESFLYKIRNVDKEINVADGVLKSNESFEQVFDELSAGAYVISYLVEEEGFPMYIKLKVKVELLR